MSDPALPMPTLGREGEPCEECGAPLAADQRYCLNCGRRRGEPRVDYRQSLNGDGQHSAPEPEPPSAPESAAPESSGKQRDYAPLAAVGGIAVLGLMLLVGVLIGKGSGSTTAPAPAPVVQVTGEGTGEKSGPGEETGAAGKKEAATKGGSSGAKHVKGGLTGKEAGATKGTVQASEGDLKELESQSGASYEEESKKLPNKIATPGKPPPIDKTKPPGGGGGAVTIK